MQPFSLDLPENWFHLHLPETDSTMLRLRQADLWTRKEEFVLLTTDFQTAGRGQRNTSWEADAEANLLFGFLFHPKAVPASQQFSISEALALAVAESLETYTDGIAVKWPNDIYWHDRKICGMLLEHDLCGSQIATTLTGVGLNVNQAVFHSDAPNPVSLLQIIGQETSRTTLLSALLRHFDHWYRMLQQGRFDQVHQAYMEKAYRREGFHPYRDVHGLFDAEIAGISPRGMLTLRRTDGTEKAYAFKEVSFVI